MTPQEFKTELDKMGVYDPRSFPSPLPSKFWERVYNSMYPHWVGAMPTSILKAFPNESKEQTQYRSDIHTSKTKPQLWQAIRDVKRVMMGDGMGIEGDSVLMDRLNSLRFGEDRVSFVDYIWNIVYPRRVLDPNALLAIIPKPTEPNQPLILDLRIFNSEFIEYYGMIGEEKVVIVRDGKKKDFYYIFTKNEVLSHKKQTNNWVTDYVYIHKNNDLGVYVLGGQTHTSYDKDTDREVTYFESDFGDAVGVMEDLERQNSQIQASTITTLFPFRIVRGMDCEVCDGKGFIEYRNEISGEIKSHHNHDHSQKDFLDYEEIEVGIGEDGQKYFDDFTQTHRKTCQKCGGTGTLPISQLDSLIIAPKSTNPFTDGMADKDDLGNDFIAFVSPPTEPIRELREQKNETKKELEESLNLTKPSKFAESGVAKEKDRDGKKTLLKGISESMGRLMENVLRGMYKYFNPNGVTTQSLQQIQVTTPSNFQIKSLADLEEEMYRDLEKKDLGTRWQNKQNIIAQKYGANSPQMEREKLILEYTQGLYLYTAKELLELEGMGLIEREDVVKALKTPAWMVFTYSKEKNKNQIFTKLNNLTQQSIPQPPSPTPPALDLGGDE